MFQPVASTDKNEYRNLAVTLTPAFLPTVSVAEVPQHTEPPVYRHVDTRESWFYSDAWQTLEDEADEDYRAGRMQTYDSVDDLLASL